MSIWRIRDALNPRFHVSGVLVTMFDGRMRLALEVIRELEKYFPQQIFKTQIPRNVRLSEAPSYGKPAILFDLKSRGAQAYLALAREMLAAGKGWPDKHERAEARLGARTGGIARRGRGPRHHVARGREKFPSPR